jgi:hypothetical protein
MDDHDDDSDDDSSISSMESNARSEDTMDRFMVSFFISADPPQDAVYLVSTRLGGIQHNQQYCGCR